MSVLDRYKLVVRDKNGKVVQIHEVYRGDIDRYVQAEVSGTNSVTVTKLS